MDAPIRSVHHINFLVRDLDAAVAQYERVLNKPADSRGTLPDRGVDVARFKVGETWIVLVNPTRPGTTPARHLEQHGEGFFLMSLEVDALAEQAQRLGDEAFAGDARTGLDGWAVRDLDPKGTCGAQLQYVVTTPRKPDVDSNE